MPFAKGKGRGQIKKPHMFEKLGMAVMEELKR